MNNTATADSVVDTRHGMGLFERYLSLWVGLAIIAGIALGQLAPAVPELSRLTLTARQGDTVCEAEAIITVTDSLTVAIRESEESRKGLPGYTFEHKAGALWRSRYDAEKNVVVINNGHRDFVYASRNKALKLRYIGRLFVKEVVYSNFPGLPPDQLLERMIELSLYMEENLK